MKTILYIHLFLLLSISARAQLLEREVSFHFTGIRLEDALTDISNTYDIPFSYSPKRIPINHPITAFVDGTSLAMGLEEVLADVPVTFKEISGQIVLKPDLKKELRQLSKLELPPMSTKPKAKLPVIETEKEPVKHENVTVRDSIKEVPVTPMMKPKKPEMILNSGKQLFTLPDIDWGLIDSINQVKKEENERLAQVSVVPGLSSNRNSEDITNNISFNLLWGKTGGVNGFEIGVIGNTVEGDVRGMQAAGLINNVKGNVYGTQMAGFVNKTGGGVGLQMAGLGNSGKKGFNGVQIAGISNVAQIGVTQMQIALFNRADTVQVSQIGFINRAEKVRGLQLGIINRSANEAGVPIGLLNFIRKGYNRIEISNSDLMQTNVGLKFGAHRFYNIIQTGMYYEESPFGNRANWNTENISWGIGYGFGTAQKIGKRGLINVEILASQINEDAGWTKEINALGQIKTTFDFRLFGKFSVFAGTTLNGMFSNRIHPETGLIGTSLPIEADITIDIEEDNMQRILWFGYTAGIRF